MRKFLLVILIFFFISGLFIQFFSSVSALALVEDSWNTKTPMTQARFGLGVVAVDGKVYAIGGFTATGYLDITEQYDPGKDTWVTLSPMPTPRNNFAIAAYDGKIYCIGGITNAPIASNVGKEGGWFYCDVTEVYDTITDSWSTKASLPVNESGLQAHVVDGKIFVITQSALYVYDPITDSWARKSSLPEHVLSKVSFVLPSTDNRIGVVGTFSIVGSPTGRTVQKVVFYDPKTDVWSEGASPPAGDFFGIAGVTSGVYAPQRVYILEAKRTVVYDPLNDSWSTAQTMPTPRSEFGVAVVDDILYVIGGSTLNIAFEFLSVNEQYIPLDYQGIISSAVPTSSTPELSQPTSEPSDSKYSTTLCLAITALALVTGVVGTGLVFLFKKSHIKKSELRE
jgi:N-acetylneuraminic acid mutarotase